MSRIAAVFVTFDQRDRKIIVPLGNHGYTGGRREFNNFKYPGDTCSITDSDYLEFQVQIGSNKFPDMKMTCKADVFAKLRDACRDLKPLSNTCDIGEKAKPLYGITASGLTQLSLVDDAFLICINTSKVEGAGFTGFDMKSGATLSVEYNIMNLSDT